MTDQHPITPPPELVEQWVRMLEYLPDKQVFSEVAQWGADQELEACCEWISNELSPDIVDMLRAARRPKPPTLKEQALAALKDMNFSLDDGHNASIIRRALEALPE